MNATDTKLVGMVAAGVAIQPHTTTLRLRAAQ